MSAHREAEARAAVGDDVLSVTLHTNVGTEDYNGIPQWGVMFDQNPQDIRNLQAIYVLPRTGGATPSVADVVLFGMYAFLMWVEDPASAKMRRIKDAAGETMWDTYPSYKFATCKTIIVDTTCEAALAALRTGTRGTRNGILQRVRQRIARLRAQHGISVHAIHSSVLDEAPATTDDGDNGSADGSSDGDGDGDGDASSGVEDAAVHGRGEGASRTDGN